MAELNNIVEWGDGYVVVSFTSDTRSQGTYVKCYDGTSFRTERGQPGLNMYPAREQTYMKRVATIVWRMVQGTNRQV